MMGLLRAPFSCRGKEARIELVENYKIDCISHLVPLPGRIKTCICGRKLDKSYYLFTRSLRNGEAYGNQESFYAGDNCADELIDRAEIARPVCVDPFSDRQLDLSFNANSNLSYKSNNAIQIRNPLNKELYDAISLLFMVWDNHPYGILSSILHQIAVYPDRSRSHRQVMVLNNAIRGSNFQGITLRGELERLAAKHGRTARQRRYPLLTSALESLRDAGELDGENIYL